MWSCVCNILVNVCVIYIYGVCPVDGMCPVYVMCLCCEWNVCDSCAKLGNNIIEEEEDKNLFPTCVYVCGLATLVAHPRTIELNSAPRKIAPGGDLNDDLGFAPQGRWQQGGVEAASGGGDTQNSVCACALTTFVSHNKTSGSKAALRLRAVETMR